MTLLKKHSALLVIFLGTFVGSGSALLWQTLLAKMLTPDIYGEFTAIYMTVNTVAIFGGFGLGALWLKVFGERGWQAFDFVKPSYHFAATTTTVSFFLLLAWFYFSESDSQLLLTAQLLCAVILLNPFLQLVGSALRLQSRHVFYALWGSLFNLLILLLLVTLILINKSSITLVSISFIILFVSLVLVGMGGAILYSFSQGNFALENWGNKSDNQAESDVPLKKISIKKVASEALPYGLAGFFYLIYFQSDIIMLRYFSTAEQTGYYSLAFVLISAALLFPSVIYNKFLQPKIHYWSYHDKDKFYQMFKKGNFYMLIAGTVLMLLLQLIMPFLIKFMFPKYIESINLIRVLLFMLPVYFLASSVGAILATQNLVIYKVKIMGFMAVVNVILNLIFIPKYHAYAAAVTTILTNILLVTLYYNFAMRKAFKSA